jgi:hypothetical protein
MFFLACLSPQEMQLSVQIGWYTAAFAFGIVLASTLFKPQARQFHVVRGLRDLAVGASGLDNERCRR